MWMERGTCVSCSRRMGRDMTYYLDDHGTLYESLGTDLFSVLTHVNLRNEVDRTALTKISASAYTFPEQEPTQSKPIVLLLYNSGILPTLYQRVHDGLWYTPGDLYGYTYEQLRATK